MGRLHSRSALLTSVVAALFTMLALSAYVALADSANSVDPDSYGNTERPFVGSWRLTSFEARTAEGQVIYPFGSDANGVLTYTSDGRMSGTIWKANRQPFAINDQQRGTPEENTAAVRSYIQYVGTFEVDRAAGTVSHHLEQSIFPNWNGTTQTRFYEFSDHGNRLELTTPPIQFGGTTLVALVAWERIDEATR